MCLHDEILELILAVKKSLFSTLSVFGNRRLDHRDHRLDPRNFVFVRQYDSLVKMIFSKVGISCTSNFHFRGFFEVCFVALYKFLNSRSLRPRDS